MTYNNTLSDKIQSKAWRFLKRLLIGIIAFYYLISGLFNIYKQYKTIRSAEVINRELENKIAKLEEERVLLKRRSEYASSSAYKERQSRNLLGEGSSDDYWLIIDEDEEEVRLMDEFYEDKKERIIREWWDLFTK